MSNLLPALPRLGVLQTCCFKTNVEITLASLIDTIIDFVAARNASVIADLAMLMPRAISKYRLPRKEVRAAFSQHAGCGVLAIIVRSIQRYERRRGDLSYRRTHLEHQHAQQHRAARRRTRPAVFIICLNFDFSRTQVPASILMRIARYQIGILRFIKWPSRSS